MTALFKAAILSLVALTAVFIQDPQPAPAESPIPQFGRDTVLVWQSENQGHTSKFVVRIADFLPGRYIEWENETTQGTIFMSEKAVMSSRVFLGSRLFEPGVDTKGKDATTLWLSQKAFAELQATGRAKLAIDSIDCWVTTEGEESLTVEVNRASRALPVLKTKDERGSERWFLNSVENPLLVKHSVRKYTQTLVSITTDRANTLRWIKGKKLSGPR
jgi:hypothetical protein